MIRREIVDFVMVGWKLDYSRNRVLISNSSLKFKSIDIPEKGFFLRQFFVLNCMIKIWLKFKTNTIFIPAFNQVNVPILIFFMKLTGKRIVTDMLISDYDTLVNDRKLASKSSIRAVRFYLNDWLCLKLSSKVLCDTDEHKQFFEAFFGADPKKLIVVPVGAESIFYPQDINKNNNVFNVLFYGGFSPLHGIEHIIKAAQRLKENEDILFTLVGSGQTKADIVSLAEHYQLKNIVFIDFSPYEQLPAIIASADVGLGIFGGSQKVKRVIPNKVFQMAACGKPIITLKTEAIESMFEDGKNILLVNENMDIAKQIAEHILSLKDNTERQRLISAEVRLLIDDGRSNSDISRQFETIIHPSV